MTVEEAAAQRAIDYGITVFKLLNKIALQVSETAQAVSALAEAVSELPDVAERYERYRAAHDEASTSAVTMRQVADQALKAAEQLLAVKEGRPPRK